MYKKYLIIGVIIAALPALVFGQQNRPRGPKQQVVPVTPVYDKVSNQYVISGSYIDELGVVRAVSDIITPDRVSRSGRNIFNDLRSGSVAPAIKVNNGVVTILYTSTVPPPASAATTPVGPKPKPPGKIAPKLPDVISGMTCNLKAVPIPKSSAFVMQYECTVKGLNATIVVDENHAKYKEIAAAYKANPKATFNYDQVNNRFSVPEQVLPPVPSPKPTFSTPAPGYTPVLPKDKPAATVKPNESASLPTTTVVRISPNSNPRVVNIEVITCVGGDCTSKPKIVRLTPEEADSIGEGSATARGIIQALFPNASVVVPRPRNPFSGDVPEAPEPVLNFSDSRAR